MPIRIFKNKANGHEYRLRHDNNDESKFVNLQLETEDGYFGKGAAYTTSREEFNRDFEEVRVESTPAEQMEDLAESIQSDARTALDNEGLTFPRTKLTRIATNIEALLKLIREGGK